MADTVNGTITVNLVEADYKVEFSKKLKEVTKTISLKGFRPGKVPPALVEKMYGKSILADTLNEFLDKAVNAFVKEQDLDTVSNPVPEAKDTDFNAKDFEFNFKIGVIPTFELPELTSFTVPTYKPMVDKARIEEVITMLGKQYGTTTNPETIEKGDFLFGILANADGTYSKDTGFSTDTLLGDSINGFLGKTLGDAIDIDVQTAFTHEQMHRVTMTKHGEDAEITGTLIFTLEKINRTSVSEMTAEFFDKVFPGDEITTEAAFLVKIEDLLNESAVADQNYYTNISAKKELANALTIELPVEFIKENLLREKEKGTEEEKAKDLELFLKGMKENIILSKIAKKYEVNVEMNEVMGYTREMIKDQFRQYGMANIEDDMLDDYVKRYLADKKDNNLSNMYERTFEAKVSQLIQDKVQPVVSEVPMEEFKEKIQALQAELNS